MSLFAVSDGIVPARIVGFLNGNLAWQPWFSR